MAISSTQYIDLLYKSLSGVAKTDLPANKSASNEAISSPLLNRGDQTWTEAGSIPSTAAAVSNIVQAYTGSSKATATADSTAQAVSGVYPTWKTNLTNWIPPQFDTANITNTYRVKIYYGAAGLTDPATSGGTQIFADGSGGTGEWYFDYASGVLNFIGGTIPSGMTGSSVIYVYGYRYIGRVGVTNLPSLTIGGTVTATTFAGSLSGTLTAGTGISGSSYNGSTNRTWTLDTSTLMTTAVNANTATNAAIAYSLANTSTVYVGRSALADTATTATAAATAYSLANTSTTYVGRAALADTATSAASAYSLANSVTFNNSNSGAASGSTFNGSSALTVSANTLGALSLSGGTVTGSVTFSGPVTFSGTATYVLSTQTYYTDNILNLHVPPSGVDGQWAVDDGKDIGFRFHYYTNSTDTNAALVLANDTKYLEWYSAGAEGTSTFAGSVYGTFKTGNIQLAGTANSTSTQTGALQVAGGIGIGGNAYVGNSVIIKNGAVVSDSASTSTQLTSVTLDTFNAATYRSAKYVVSISNSGLNQYQTSDITLVHDGASSFLQATSVYSGNKAIMNFTTVISDGNVLLQGAGVGTGANTNVVKISRIYIPV